MADLRALEHSTLKVPYEILNKKFRLAQKTIDREIDGLTKHAIQPLAKMMSGEKVSVAEALALVESLENRAEVLERKTTEAVSEEQKAAESIQRRLDHLNVRLRSGLSEAEAEDWRRQRVDRLIIEYLLRAGSYQTAVALAERSRMDYLSNLNVFLTAQKVEEALRCGETGRALEWCQDNKSKLRRLGSRLELHIREQEFIELLRAGRRDKAMEYSRQHFKDVDSKIWAEELGAVNALLAFGPDTEVDKYAAYYSPERWSGLVEEFMVENFRLYQLAHQSVFSACLQSGLSALKTPECGGRGRRRRGLDADRVSVGVGGEGCPACVLEVAALGADLPFAHASQSRLVCAASGEQMNENNPALMLPNGMVYGRNALHRIASQNDGDIVCPRTGHRFQPHQTQRVFVM